MATKIQTVKGTREFYPDAMALRNYLFEKVRAASQSFGYQEYDGPFIETREQIAGYFLIDAKDFEQATQIAIRVPGARIGTVEVRPLREISGLPGEE